MNKLQRQLKKVNNLPEPYPSNSWPTIISLYFDIISISSSLQKSKVFLLNFEYALDKDIFLKPSAFYA